MVRLLIKKADETQFLFETTVTVVVQDLLNELTEIYNARLKVDRICTELGELAKHGISLPPNMQGLADEQIADLKLKDEWADKCIPSGGAIVNLDPIGRRNGQAPNEKMADVISRTVSEAKKIISNKQASANVCMTKQMVQDALDQLRGAVMIVYPMGLPPHDPIQMEIENQEDLQGQQASLQVLETPNTSLWFSGKEMKGDKKLQDYVGKNEKTKIIAKLQKKGQGPPGRERIFSEEEQKAMMAHAYKKQEEFKKLEQDNDDAYLNSQWADSSSLKKQFHGLKNIKW
ncbi:cilia- and flagella-associated protein 298-like [Anneissia japonica]|uniref:cilia- and flagella-associated protein 298-like n=1 Tax=Anneissia japonica TaxID=1529436 RepID=UPI0014255E9E|nr:cilia- and flagella-associated protein 298-like [Anneissia japonica]